VHADVEECDDANDNDNDACLATCTAAVCGDGIVHANVEQCDNGDNEGEYEGCMPDCKTLAPYCGDGVLDPGLETCDDGNQVPGDGCDASCMTEQAPECTNYIELTDESRHMNFVAPPGWTPLCDEALNNGWYRFTGAAGNKMPTNPMVSKSCGANASGWLTDPYPDTADEGAIVAKVCYTWLFNTCWESNDILVRKCDAQIPFFVFKLPNTPVCSARYCGAG
jgi:cysteine-rich repeat protein